MLPSAAPQTPVPASQVTTVTGGASNLTLPQNVGRAMTLQDVQLLQNRRSELSRQLSSATGRRSEVVRDIGRDVIGRPGLEARLKVLDERIVQLEKDISQNGQLLAQAPPNLVEETSPPPSFPSPVRNVNVNGISIAFIFAVLMPISVAWARRIFRRPYPSAPALSPDTTDRISRIELAVESIAVEVERISEGQRFVTKLMSEPRQLGAGPAERIVVPQGERVPLDRKDPA
jgi:hypothetical protein